MIWLEKLLTRLGKHHPEQTCTDDEDRVSAEQTDRDYANAQQALANARLRREEVRQVTSTLAFLNNRNHYGESIREAMMPKEKHV